MGEIRVSLRTRLLLKTNWKCACETRVAEKTAPYDNNSVIRYEDSIIMIDEASDGASDRASDGARDGRGGKGRKGRGGTENNHRENGGKGKGQGKEKAFGKG